MPPKPEREELPQVQTLKDIAGVITYYEHLVEEWEVWGDTVTTIVGEKNGN